MIEAESRERYSAVSESSSLAETFFLRLADAGTATWGAFDATGRLVGSLGRGPLQSAQAALAGRRCTALVDAVDVLSAEAALPAASQARLRQIVPFSLEELLADDVDQMVFAIGAQLPSGATQIAAVAENTDGRLARASCARRESCRTPCAPRPTAFPTSRRRSCSSSKASASPDASPGRPPFVFDGLDAESSSAARVGAQTRRAGAAPRSRVHRRGGPQPFRDELAQLAGQFASADVKILNDGVFPHFAATLAQRTGTNLLQGAYAPKSNWLAMAQAVAAGRVSRRPRARYSPSSCKAPSTGSCGAPTLRSATSSRARASASSATRARRSASAKCASGSVPSAGTTTEDFLSTLAAIARFATPRCASTR